MLMPDSDTFSIDVQERSEATHLRLIGRFGVATRASLDRLIRRRWPHDVVLDLEGLTFMDGAAWLVVMDLHHRVDDGGQRLQVVNVPARIRRIFEVTETEYVLSERP